MPDKLVNRDSAEGVGWVAGAPLSVEQQTTTGVGAGVPLWLVDADVSTDAIRLYRELLRSWHAGGGRMPDTDTLPALQPMSAFAVGVAMGELVGVGAVEISDRGRADAAGDRLRHHLRGTPPAGSELHRTSAGSAQRRIRRARNLLTGCGMDDWPGYVAQVHLCRRLVVGGPMATWTEGPLLAAIDLAVRGRRRPMAGVAEALLCVAADPDCDSPARVAESGPWWFPTCTPSPGDRSAAVDGRADWLAVVEADLDAADGLRPALQAQARAGLAADGVGLTRAGVLYRAHTLLRRHQFRHHQLGDEEPRQVQHGQGVQNQERRRGGGLDRARVGGGLR